MEGGGIVGLVRAAHADPSAGCSDCTLPAPFGPQLVGQPGLQERGKPGFGGPRSGWEGVSRFPVRRILILRYRRRPRRTWTESRALRVARRME